MTAPAQPEPRYLLVMLAVLVLLGGVMPAIGGILMEWKRKKDLRRLKGPRR